jgi:hypothetical protein
MRNKSYKLKSWMRMKLNNRDQIKKLKDEEIKIIIIITIS